VSPGWSTARPELRGRREECDRLDHLLREARAGRSQVLVLRGEAGMGKTALLDHLARRAGGCRVLRVVGVEPEMELAYAGLHQLCAPFLDRLDRLPELQRGALGTAFGITAGPPPDRFLVGLAVLTLLARVAEDEPLVCLVDDAHWLDRVSTQALAFAGRRLLADRVALVLAVRGTGDGTDLAGLPELPVGPLSDGDARALLESVLPGPVDPRVRDRIVAESHGNPLALLELPRTGSEPAGGFGPTDTLPLAGRLEQGFLSRLGPLPADTRRLLLVAAAEPLGDLALLWRAAARLGIGADSAGPAEAAGLVEFDGRVRFRHPLVRSAAYRAGSRQQRRDAHLALAGATDAALDPDRRAWHRARAAAGPDEAVAAELELSAGRAAARGGLAAAAVLLDHAAILTPDPARRARRGLAAARAKRDCGALDAALSLLVTVEAGPPDALRTAEVEHLRGRIAFDQRRAADAARLLLGAARRLHPLDAPLARETYLEALGAAIWSIGPDDPDGAREVAEAARAAPPAPDPPRPADLVLDALATRVTDGHAAAAPALVRAVDAVRAETVEPAGVARWLWLAGNRASGIAAIDVWDFEARYDLASRQVRLARETGALVQLQFALNFLANAHLLAGELAAAEHLVEEDRLIAEAAGVPVVGYSPMLLAALRGQEEAASALIAGTLRLAAARGLGRMATFAAYTTAVLHNSLGRHAEARDAARPAFDADVIGYGPLVLSELAEAASRTGDADLVAAALDRLTGLTRVTRTDWTLGIEARVRALLDEDATAEGCYRESIERLGRTRLRAELARTRLLHGEWLRRRGRRLDARDELRAAHGMLAAMGLEAFAERARRELLATGETVRKRRVETAEELTAQEAQIARLARDGLSNPEIATRLYLSPRTVEWHLRKVFGKLGITSRRQLRRALPAAVPA
jgi:DNA-binding CsgD family transcriptional regulator